jgi:hypothetical protein
MQIVWTQIFNAITMISPFISWFKHRHNLRNTRTHNLLLIHLPLSTLYHLISAFKDGCKIQKILLTLDIALIHAYSLSATNEISKCLNITYNKSELNILRTSYCMNTFCIAHVSIHKNNNDINFNLTRITSLFLHSYVPLQKLNVINKLFGLGSISVLLYMFDNKLYNYGHSIFHIILGLLHNRIFELFTHNSDITYITSDLCI